MSRPLRAAVIGASGIGKHHAKWLHALGCEVVGFAGTSAERVEATAQVLRGIFPFAGTGYVGVEALLEAAGPDLVAICSPAPLHPEHFSLAARRGCHILCEKPLVWDPTQDFGRLLAEGAQMVRLARERGLVAAINTQYASVVAPYLRLLEQAGVALDGQSCSRFFMQMDSRGGKQGAGGEKVWLDLASHPLSVLMAFVGPGAMVPGSERCAIGERQVDTSFTFRTACGHPIGATVRVCNVPEGPLVRRFGVDGVLVDYEGRNDEDGVFAAYLKLGDLEMKATDFMQLSITRFVHAVRGEGEPLATLEEGLANLEMQLRLLQVGRS